MTCPGGHSGPRVRDNHWAEPLRCGYCDRVLDEEWELTGWTESGGRVWVQRVIPFPDEQPKE